MIVVRSHIGTMQSCCTSRPAAAAADDATGEAEALRARLADAATKNKKLLALVHQQHSQIQVGVGLPQYLEPLSC